MFDVFHIFHVLRVVQTYSLFSHDESLIWDGRIPKFVEPCPLLTMFIGAKRLLCLDNRALKIYGLLSKQLDWMEHLWC